MGDLTIRDKEYQKRSAFNENIDNRYGQLLKKHFDHPEHIIQNIHLYIKRYHLTRLLQFYELFKMTINVPGEIVELGVFRGASLLSFARMLEAFCMGDRTKKVYGFDHFKGLQDFSEKDGIEYADHDKRKGGWCSADYYDELKELIELFDAERFMPMKERVILVEGDVRETIPEFVKQNPGIRISLLHFDLDLYEPTLVGLKHLYNKVVPGGVVIFDEYGFPEFAGETEAVDEFFGDKRPKFKRFEWFSNPGAYFVKE